MDNDECWCTVRVWFGSVPISEHAAHRTEAASYADAMRVRFRGLRVTTEEHGTERPTLTVLPERRLWNMTVHARGV